MDRNEMGSMMALGMGFGWLLWNQIIVLMGLVNEISLESGERVS